MSTGTLECAATIQASEAALDVLRFTHGAADAMRSLLLSRHERLIFRPEQCLKMIVCPRHEPEALDALL